jgi:hypothetical protein
VGTVEISLRSFDQSVQEAYRRLYSDDPEKSPELLEWRFVSNPHGPAKFVTASDGANIIGMIALLPTRLVADGRETLAYQAIDVVIEPPYRGHGLFVRMGRAVQDPQALGGDVLWGFPNANAAPGWYGRLGWTDFGQVPLLLRPLRSGFLLGRVHPKFRPVDFPLVGRRRNSPHLYASGADLCADFAGLWQRIRRDIGPTVDRGGQWIQWRLCDKPGANYRCVGAKSADGELEAFVALKISDKHGARLCYVMEALSLPEQRAALTELLQGELATAAAQGAEAALAWCPNAAPNYRAYRRAWFLPVPPRLRPIEINFGARALTALGVATAAPNAGWYVSFLDSDTN